MSYSLPTLTEILQLPCVQAGRPEVVCGEQGLQRPIRWVHVSELTDIASLLRGGELVLTTGIALPNDSRALGRYVRDLDEAGVHGLVVELGRKFASIPTALVNAAKRCDLPVIALTREIAFVELTEAVHRLIVDTRVDQLERAYAINKRFSALALEGASVQSVLDVATELAGVPVVLENLAHRVLAFAPKNGIEQALLTGWERRSRTQRPNVGLSAVTDDETWVSAPVGARGSVWGRLVAVCRPDAPAEPLVVAQAAATLALTRLSERDQVSAWAQSHADLLKRLHERSFASADAVNAEASALGVPLEGRNLIGVAVFYSGPGGDGPSGDLLQHGHLERMDLIVTDLHISALMQPLDDDGVLLLVSLPSTQRTEDVIGELAAKIHADTAAYLLDRSATIGVGSLVCSPTDARQTLAEAIHVTVAATASRHEKSFYKLPDIRLRGLLHLLRDDSRLQTFVERELGALIEFDQQHGTHHLATLEAYLRSGCNKSVAATRLQVSRPTLYAHIERIGELLDADLEDVEIRASLHVAVLALESVRSS